jgi:hypothetical protein
MASKDPMDRLFALSKISSILLDYKKNNFDSLDKELIRGIYQRNTEETKTDFLARKKPDEVTNKKSQDESRFEE